MTTKTVYFYKGDGGVIQTTIAPPLALEEETEVRLIADTGKELVKGDYRTSCIDVPQDDVANWTEIDISKE